MKNANDLIHSFSETENVNGYYNGLTKREYFAAMRKPQEGDSSITLKIAKALMGSEPPHADKNIIEYYKWWAEAEERYAVMRADALIKALNEQP